MKTNRGDVFWVNLAPSVGSEIRKKRPCVLVGANPINRARRTVVIVPLSSSGKPRPPLAVKVTCLKREAVAVCDQIRAIDKTRLIERADTLTNTDMKKIESGLRQVLMLE